MASSTAPTSHSYRRFFPCKSALALGIALASISVPIKTSLANLIAGDDFTYPEGVLAKGGNDGGTGWAGPWAGNKRPRIHASDNLSFSSNGYEIAQGGAGIIASTDDHSGVSSRNLSNTITGTPSGTDVWFSVLVRVEKNQVQSGRIGLHFNVSETGPVASRLGASAGFILANTDFRPYVSTGPITGSPSGVRLDLDATHLIIGKISLKDTGESDISIWFDPSNVTTVEALGEPAFAYSADFGGSIANVGVETYSGAKEGGAGSLDVLRIGSDLASVVSSLP